MITLPKITAQELFERTCGNKTQITNKPLGHGVYKCPYCKKKHYTSVKGSIKYKNPNIISHHKDRKHAEYMLSLYLKYGGHVKLMKVGSVYEIRIK